MKNILIADDEESLRTLIQATLECPEFRIVQASNGADALRVANSEEFDLIVLDWMMPDMNGVDVLQKLRQRPESEHVPVVMLTARGHAKDQEYALKLGAAAYIMKPFSPLELLETINRILGFEGNTRKLAAAAYSQVRSAARPA